MRLFFSILFLITLSTGALASGGAPSGGTGASGGNDSLESSEFHDLIEEAKKESTEEKKDKTDDAPIKKSDEDKNSDG